MPDPRPTQDPPVADVSAELAYESDNPFAGPGVAAGAVRGGANMYGANSIETFCDAGPLSLTHDDADGWVNYVDNFTALNFRYRVCAFYHSGHGGMDANGVFCLPLGSAWAGNDCTALSSSMRLGNEYGRYLFLSTCTSLRVLGGHSPIRTWQAANLGLRMIFGYETVSWDNPNYGKFFWQEWQKNKSLGTAWLDARWRIAHDQAPSVAACGATQQEAQDRVYNERYFNRTRASTAWWWWRWYNAARAAAREPVRALPREVIVPQFRPAAASIEAPGTLAERFGIGAQATAAATRGAGGSVLLRDGQTTVAQDPSGGIFARLASANLDNTMPLALGRARSRAEDAVQQYGLSPDSNLVFDRTILASAAGGTPEGSGRLEPERVTETIVQFRQAINGVPVISPSDTGLVRVAVDNDGRVTQVHASVREIEDLGRPGRTLSTRGPQPGRNGGGSPEEPAAPAPEPEHESALGAAVGRRLRDLIARGAAPVGIETVPGSTEIGYAVRGNIAALVARKAIEVDFGSGYRKRYWVEAEIAG